MSLMYPTIFALGLQGLGADSKVGGSFIVMAIIGGAILTPVMGIISDRQKSLAIAYLVPLFGYCVIAGYSFYQECGVFADREYHPLGAIRLCHNPSNALQVGATESTKYGSLTGRSAGSQVFAEAT